MAGSGHAPRWMRAPRPTGRMRGRLPTMPPPGVCARALISTAPLRRRGGSGWARWGGGGGAAHVGGRATENAVVDMAARIRHPPDNLGDDRRVEDAGRHVIQKEERLSA